MRIETHRLDSGIHVILIPMNGTELFTQLCMVRGGSRYETARTSGISHFLEHMMFKGTSNRPSARDISIEIDGSGAVNNAFTAEEVIGYWVKSPARFFEQVTDILADQMLHSILDPDEIEREKGPVVEEIKTRKLSPSTAAYEALMSLIYGDQAAGRDITGTEDTVRALTRGQVRRCMSRFFTVENMVIVAAGKLPPSRRALSLMNAHYANVPAGSPPRKYQVRDRGQKVPGVVILERDNPQTSFALALQGPSLLSEERPTFIVLATVLGGGMSSRLFSEVRGRRGLAYSIYASSSSQTDTGSLFIGASVSPHNLQETLDVIKNELVKLAHNLVPLEELVKVQSIIEGRIMRSIESSNNVATSAAGGFLKFGRAKSPEETLAEIEAVSAEEIQALAERILVNSGMNLAVVGPHAGEEEQLREVITL